MSERLRDHFDQVTLQRGDDYAARGFVVSVEKLRSGDIVSRVKNGQGQTYNQIISTLKGRIIGTCSCPVVHNCKHVAAALICLAEEQGKEMAQLDGAIGAWISRVRETAPFQEPYSKRPEDYPNTVKDRIIYILSPFGPEMKVDIYKGRVGASSSTFNKSMRRYDIMNVLRSINPPNFIRPIDLELLPALMQAGVWDARYSYGSALPALLQSKGEDAISLFRRLCETGRFHYEPLPDACLLWSEDRPDAKLGWHVAIGGDQQLGFVDSSGAPLLLRGIDGATFWIDIQTGRMGALAQALSLEVLRLIEKAPVVSAGQTELVSAALPDRMAGLVLPRPRTIRHMTRPPMERYAKLTLGAETARENAYQWGAPVQLPTLTLGFVYEGQEISIHGPEPRIVHDGEVITLLRDLEWEDACLQRLMEAGAIPVEELEAHSPSDRMMDCDLVFADDELSISLMDVSRLDDAIDFAFRVVPSLRGEGWEIVEGRKWPYRLSEETASLSITTQDAPGEGFQGNNWFSLGFQAEIAGKAVDVAPLIAAFLEQFRQDLSQVPDIATMNEHLAQRPVYLNRGKQGFVMVDLTPLAPLLHMFLLNHIELSGMHPSDASIVKLAEEALAGSDVRFSDNAGILPLARSLQVLAEVENFPQPKGLNAQLRDYQAHGTAWMAALLKNEFGGVLADDMGLGKTLQTLALLQARQEAGAESPSLLILPTSLIHTWRAQAEQFTPNLRVVTLHGNDRAELREAALQADLVITTYPLLARDRDWLRVGFETHADRANRRIMSMAAAA